MMPMGAMGGGMPGMAYQQPTYGMQGPGGRAPLMGQQMAPGYGPGYIDTLNGAPTTVYGAGYGGGCMMPTGVQPGYSGQPMYQQQYQAGVQPGVQPAYQTGYQQPACQQSYQ